jgi:hypothetical protein
VNDQNRTPDEDRKLDEDERAADEAPTLSLISSVAQATLGVVEVGSDAGSMFS